MRKNAMSDLEKLEKELADSKSDAKKKQKIIEKKIQEMQAKNISQLGKMCVEFINEKISIDELRNTVIEMGLYTIEKVEQIQESQENDEDKEDTSTSHEEESSFNDYNQNETRPHSDV